MSLYECDNINIIGSYVEHHFINIHDNTEYCLGVHFIPFTAHGLLYCSKYLQAFNSLTHMLRCC